MVEQPGYVQRRIERLRMEELRGAHGQLVVERIQRQDLEREEEELRHHRSPIVDAFLGISTAGEPGMEPVDLQLR